MSGRVRHLLSRLSITAVHLHASLAVVWGAILIPTMLFWRNSLVWVVFMSWYANWVGELSAFQAARAERETVSNDQYDKTMRELAAVRRELKAIRKAQTS